MIVLSSSTSVKLMVKMATSYALILTIFGKHYFEDLHSYLAFLLNKYIVRIVRAEKQNISEMF